MNDDGQAPSTAAERIAALNARRASGGSPAGGRAHAAKGARRATLLASVAAVAGLTGGFAFGAASNSSSSVATAKTTVATNTTAATTASTTAVQRWSSDTRAAKPRRTDTGQAVVRRAHRM